MRRKERRRSETPTVALAGYTNAGKSTLLNALTDAGVSVRDRLFETLDPTTRGFEHEGRRYLVTDTVGFVRRLPHQLVEGFAATLEETLVADLVLHVVDASGIRRAARRADRGRRLRPARDRSRRASASARAQQDRRRGRRSAGAASRTATRRRCRSRRSTAKGSTSCRARIAEHFAERFELVRLLAPVRGGRAAQRALRARGADRGARGHRGRRPGRRAPAAARAAPLHAVPLAESSAAECMTSSRSSGSHEDATLPDARVRGRRGPGSRRRASGSSSRPGTRALVGTGLAVAIPEGHAGFVQPRSGLAAEHGITIVNSPGLVDSGYRGELKVILLNTDRERDVRRRAGDADRAARRRPGRDARSRVEVDGAARRASAARKASAAPRR